MKQITVTSENAKEVSSKLDMINNKGRLELKLLEFK